MLNIHSDLEPPQPQQRRRSREVKPIRLQGRDLDLFVSLSIGRYLPVHALEWLHYPGWRERYKRYLAERATDRDALYYPTPNLYHRLAALRTGSEPLVHRVARAVERASRVYNRLPDAYTLAESGA